MFIFTDGEDGEGSQNWSFLADVINVWHLMVQIFSVMSFPDEKK